MASRSKCIAGNHTQQNTRLFSVRNTLLALTIFSSGFTSSGYAAFGEPAGDEFIVKICLAAGFYGNVPVFIGIMFG